ncbi:MAG: hypothetical protein C5B59_13415 [Bacteroidetes bacterium]|nr:MAG: hypothetical protein C5B59_13415 [Bacteroidota bacterium]
MIGAQIILIRRVDQILIYSGNEKLNVRIVHAKKKNIFSVEPWKGHFCHPSVNQKWYRLHIGKISSQRNHRRNYPSKD